MKDVSSYYPTSLPESLRTIPEANTTAKGVGVILGEGIGPAVIDATLEVLHAACALQGDNVEVILGPQLRARDKYGLVLDDEARGFYSDCAASATPVLHGPAGGRYVYELRKFADLFVKITPVVPLRVLQDASLLKPELIAGADMLIVRDNAAGAYQGEFGVDPAGLGAFQHAHYSKEQVRRVLAVGFDFAAKRQGRLTVVTKPGGIPTISALWRDTALELECDGVDLDFIEVDNACFQLGSNPKQFDVIATPNLFGDVVSDTGSIVLGSRGLSFSANFSSTGFGVYQTAHGAAHDLVGSNSANPVAQLLTLAWLLELSLNKPNLARTITNAIVNVLGQGVRTADIAAQHSAVVTTTEFTKRVIASLVVG